MEIEILSKKENPVIDRIEVKVLAKHMGAPTPKREEIRELVAGAFKAEKDRVIVDHMESGFGQGQTHAYVKVYPSKKRAMEVERRSILVRNKLADPKAKKEKGKAAAPTTDKRKTAASPAEKGKADAPPAAAAPATKPKGA